MDSPPRKIINALKAVREGRVQWDARDGFRSPEYSAPVLEGLENLGFIEKDDADYASWGVVMLTDAGRKVLEGM